MSYTLHTIPYTHTGQNKARTRPLTTGGPLKDYGWSANFNQKVVPDQDVIREHILDDLSFKAASPPTKKYIRHSSVSKSSYGNNFKYYSLSGPHV